ncbi:hypothetical protein Sru01_60440 [Sphaerisporangium rufum]|uniref:Coenzyme Q-binding protein COQ10 START domain-containing protein n=1 Tax=Sphaerisporangium rufum TaxID=1381558 RepID=A0A919R7F5_9ACTN|nr:SRPBCC family protein [Sphaerisporangium rufum]GII81062.1 hypothetical protein Sru01_60440 [Sphaerisporangium rufum]
MSTIEHSVDVAVPVRTAYDQWTQFESFPEFMEGVQSIKQISDTRLVWDVEVAGVHRRFEAEVTEQRPDERVAWNSVEGPRQAGVVTFHRITDDTTRVMLQMDFEPEGLVETVGDKLQLVRTRVHGDLERFKKFIESRGHETGGWRGEVPSPDDAGHGAATRTAPDEAVLPHTGTTAGPGVATGTGPGPATPAGTATAAPLDRTAPPSQVGGDFPPEPALPAPGTGPVSPVGTPRLDEEPPLAPDRPERLA